MFYAGIGSRKTPLGIQEQMTVFARVMNKEGYTLRSGGADGADMAFEKGAGGNCEIYLPWKGFNGNPSPLWPPSPEAFIMGKHYHKGWNNLSEDGKKYHARNCHQILGQDLKTPVEFVACWTKDGKASGGTGQAIRIAMDLGIYVEYFK